MVKGKAVTKKDLIAHIKKQANVSANHASLMLDAILNEISASLVQQKSVQCAGFGKLQVRQKPPMKIKHPQTRKVIHVDRTFVASLQPSKTLKAKVNPDDEDLLFL